MSNKLYTEKQVIKAMMLRENQRIGYTTILEEHLTHIELPTDEEIEQYLKSFPYTKHLDDGQYNDGVISGAELGIEWVINKIQGGNNEQQ